MTATFSSIGSAHNSWTRAFDSDVATCRCGHVMRVPPALEDLRTEDAIDEVHLSHKEAERQEWLKKNGYGPIDARWATCVYCGCVVSGIDDHRTVCP